MIKRSLLVLLLLSVASIANAQPPFVTLVDNQPEAGTIYTANLAQPGSALPLTSEIVQMDEHGNILRHQPVFDFQYQTLDVQLQPNGVLTYGSAPHPATGLDGKGRFYVLDTATWAIKDTLRCSSPYKTDVHELRMFRDGGYALLGTSDTLMARKDWLPGSTDTKQVHVVGNTVEIFDANKKSVFLWRGIDHYGVADFDTISKQVKITDTNLDFQHTNSIDFDPNGNILLSNRHLCEVSLIDRTTGNFIWRLGGRHNEFKLLNDSVWFSYQHCARLLPNGHVLLYDNALIDSIEGKAGSKHWSSRAAEYEIDLSAKTAKLVWEFHHTPDVQALAMGSVERLSNGNTLIGWGFTTGKDSVTVCEVTPDKTTLFEMAFVPTIEGSPDYCYRFSKILPQQMGVAIASDVKHDVWISNESSDRFTIHTPEESAQVSIYDVLGRRLVAGNTTGLMNIDASNFGHGTYFCRVEGHDWHRVVLFSK